MVDQVKLFLAIPKTEDALASALFSGDPAKGIADFEATLVRYLESIMGQPLGIYPLLQSVPMLGTFFDDERVVENEPQEIVFGLNAVPRDLAEGLVTVLAELAPAIHVGADPGLSPADIWCPGTAESPLFGDLEHAFALIGAGALPGAGADGEDVRVVIVDQGLNKDYFKNDELVGKHGPRGWVVKPNIVPGTAPPQPDRVPGEAAYGHGTRMAKLILKLAPKAKLYDLPLLPDRIRDLPTFLSTAMTALKGPLDAIHGSATEEATPGPWVLCNAWGVYSLALDMPIGPSTPQPVRRANYGQNPNHPLNRRIAALSRSGRKATPGADAIFAAGNCGQFCPDGRCGPAQVGPGRSIYGAAALRQVTTTGAVRCDRTWLGYASEGPSPDAFASRKPDLCAPSQLVDPDDAATSYTGTSTACALTAGAVAALRGKNFPWDSGSPPDTRGMIAMLRAAALRRAGEAKGDPRRGSGTLDLQRFVEMFRA